MVGFIDNDGRWLEFKEMIYDMLNAQGFLDNNNYIIHNYSDVEEEDIEIFKYLVCLLEEIRMDGAIDDYVIGRTNAGKEDGIDINICSIGVAIEGKLYLMTLKILKDR